MRKSMNKNFPNLSLRSLKTRCLKGFKKGTDYSIKKQMLSELLEEGVQKFNIKYGVVGSKIVLTIDNCATYPHMESLKWIKLIFFLRNITSHTAVIDQHVTLALKAKFYSLAVLKLRGRLYGEFQSGLKYSVRSAGLNFVSTI